MLAKISVLLLLILSVSVVKSDSVEQKLSKLLNEANKNKSIYLFGGLSLEKTEDQREFSSSKDDLVEQFSHFLNSHVLQFSVPKENQLTNGNYSLPKGNLRLILQYLNPTCTFNSQNIIKSEELNILTINLNPR